MFIFDVETLGVESTSVVLSAAIIHFNPEEQPNFQKLLDDACFVKFAAKDQIKRLNRTVDKGTLEWWSKQHSYVKEVSFDPSVGDVTVEGGLQFLRDYMAKFPKSKEQTMWARGSLDQLAIDSLAKSVDQEPITGYNVWRDVRTAVDLLYGTTNGYVEVDHPEFNRASIIKHHPVHDCALDAMQLLYGKTA